MPAAPKAAKSKAEFPDIAATVEHADLEAALLAVQNEIHTLDLGRDATGQVQSRTYNYLTLDKLHAAVLPLLNKHGLIWVCRPTEGKLKYELIHTDTGGKVEGWFQIGEGLTPQQQGSEISYYRRYALLCVTGIQPHGEDDDGKQATEGRQAARQRQSEARHGPEILTPDECKRMVEAIREKGLEPIRVYERVGITEPTKVTRDQANAVRNLLAQETLV